MIPTDTIIALASPPGMGAIAVFRLSGNKAIDIANTIFVSKKNDKKLINQKSHTLHLGNIIDENKIIDEVLVSIFKAPNSYTGENVVEISCHGSTYIQQEILNLCIKSGCRLAESGEFTLRAFLNGKMDLSQAEAVADVIASNSAVSHQIAIQQMKGGISNELKVLRNQLLDFAALIELELDFSGEDVEFADRTKFKELLYTIKKTIQKLIDTFTFGNAMKNGIPIAIIGEPNVGKSTLLNALLKEEKAIVSDIAGTTRDVIEDEIVIDGVVYRFIDTAGLRTTTDVVETIGIKKAIEKASNAQLIIYLIEAKKALTGIENDLETIQTKLPNKKIITIFSKLDEVTQNEASTLQNNHPSAILLSVKNNWGLDALYNTLTALYNKGALSTNDIIVTNSRHFEALNNALESLLQVEKGIQNDISADLFAIDIRECLRFLGNITGDYDVDKDILGHIFSNFCIGK